MEKGYWILLFIRFAFILAPGYVHPDEFFQSPEILARDVFGCNTTIPWEFSPENPCRSITPPFIASGIPFIFVKMISNIVSIDVLNSVVLLYFPRLFVFFLSLLVDFSAFEIAKCYHLDANALLLCLSSSWTMLVFHTRTFSNTLESIIFCLSAVIVLTTDWKSLSPSPSSSTKRNSSPTFSSHIISRSFLLGVLMAFGCFTRFTFPVFFLPLGLFVAYQSLSHSLSQGVRVGGTVLLSSSIAGCLLAVIDSFYFGTLSLTLHNAPIDIFSIPSLHFSQWEHLSIQYNLDPANLAIHGTHPRWVHGLVNAPLLFGPLVLTFPLGTNPLWTSTPLRFFILSVGTGVGLLSVADHQEPRFLLPLLLPFVVSSHRNFFGTSSRPLFRWVWLAFNCSLALFYGGLHQGGLIPALHKVPHMFPNTHGNLSSPVTHHVITFHTYMSPRHLLCGSEISVTDLMGKPFSDLEMSLVPLSEALILLPGKLTASEEWKELVSKKVDSSFQGEEEWTLLHSFLQFSGEEPPGPEGLSSLSLQMWKYAKKNKKEYK